MTEELWHQCVDKNYEPIETYEVSSLGRVRSLDHYTIQKNRWGDYRPTLQRGCILQLQTKRGTDYKRCVLNGQHWSVHVLVALAFPEICGRWFEGATVDHLNGVKDDNRPENLCFKTIEENRKNPNTLENIRSASLRNLVKASTDASRLKMALTKSNPVVADGLTQMFMNTYALADELDVSNSAVWLALKGKNKTVRGFTVSYACDR